MSLLTLVAKYSSVLSAGITTSSPTATLSRVLTKKLEVLPAGLYGFILDRGLAEEETVIGTLSGSVLTFTVRGVSDLDGLTSIAANIFPHRKGCSVELTAHPVFGSVASALSGDTALPGVPLLPSDRVITLDQQVVDKEYVDALAIAGAPKASVTVFGITQLSANPADALIPIAAGTNDPRIPTQPENDAMAGNGGTPSASNKYLTEEGGSPGLRTPLTEETSSGIIAGSPVFMQSDGEGSKTATIKEWIAVSRHELINYSSTSLDPTEINVVWLEDNKFAFFFMQQVSTTYYYFIGLGAIDNGGKISIWNEKVLQSTTSNFPYSFIKKLSATKVIFAYYTATSSVDLYIVNFGTDNVITVGSASTFATENTELAIDRLSDSSFIVVTRDASSDDCYVQACTVSGTTITAGGVTNFDTAASTNVTVVALTSTKAIVGWTSGAVAHVRVANISGTTVTAGAGTYTAISASAYLHFARLADDKFAAGANNSTIVKVIAGSVSGDVITLGALTTVEAYVDGGGIDRGGIVAIGTNAVAIQYRIDDSLNVYDCHFAYITFAALVPTIANITLITNKYSTNQAGGAPRPVMAFVNGYLLMAMSYGGSSTVTPSQTLHTFKPVPNEVYIGMAQAAPSGGSFRTLMRGRSGSILSGLTFGKRYLYNQDGTLATNGLFNAGVALSATELLLE